MELTAEERAILAHVKVDVDAWVANAINLIGEDGIRETIERHRQSYLDALAALGENYQTRAEREAAAAAAEAAAQQAAAEAAAANEAIRQQIVTVAQSAVGVALTQLDATQRAALLFCLLYRVRGVTSDMKVKPLSEWVR